MGAILFSHVNTLALTNCWLGCVLGIVAKSSATTEALRYWLLLPEEVPPSLWSLR